MKLDFWINDGTRSETFTAGTFGWVWHEGDCLLAGEGPRFGNDDPTHAVVATMREGMWYPTKAEGKGYTDFDVQATAADHSAAS